MGIYGYGGYGNRNGEKYLDNLTIFDYSNGDGINGYVSPVPLPVR